ncbi:MAG: ABC transporter permease [candidate division WOR-3 bacterium]
MRKFSALFLKELKELLNKQLIISFVIMVVLFRVIGQINKSAMQKLEERQEIGILVLDSGPYGEVVKKALQNNFKLSEITGTSEPNWIDAAKKADLRTFVVIPDDFSLKISAREKASIRVYTIARTLGIKERAQKQLINSIIRNVSEAISHSILQKNLSIKELEYIKEPVTLGEYVHLKGKTYNISSEIIFGYMTIQSTLIPIILFLLLIMTSQMIAAAMGQEKENKTLETLLTTPVPRFSIIAAKMLSSIIIAAVFAGAYLYGFKGYMISPFESQFKELENIAKELEIALSGTGLFGFGVSIFLALVAGLLMSMLISVFVQDTKSAQVAITPVMIMLLIPYFLSFTVDIAELTGVAKVLIYLIPFTHPFYFYRFYILGNYKDLIFGISYLIIFNLILALVILKLFSTDILITSRLDIRRQR